VADSIQPIIIKRKAIHGGHHGGAWKVAYADFVTAMMALFIVLWLLSASKEVQVAVGGYFRDPRGSSKNVGNNKDGSDFVPVKKLDMQRLKESIIKSIHHMDPQDKLKNHIEITLTEEGLRIELLESAKGTFFDLGGVQPTPAMRDLLQVLSKELGKIPNKISIEGHTDSKPYSQVKAYDNFDLSCDRANATRRVMQEEGVRPDQIAQVRGFADQHLRTPEHPEDPSNRRISLVVQYVVKDGSELALPTEITQTAKAPPA
jgi:chemotaxis protein MotB